jgi:hypothetical protein
MLLASRLILMRLGEKFDVKTAWARECGSGKEKSHYLTVNLMPYILNPEP